MDEELWAERHHRRIALRRPIAHPRRPGSQPLGYGFGAVVSNSMVEPEHPRSVQF